MTREEAIARIKDHKAVHKMNEPRAIYISEALDIAIEALNQQPCDDCISRQAVLDQAVDYGSKTYLIPVYSVKNLPPVIPQPKIGKWIMHPKGIYAHLVCNKCLSSAPYNCQTNYCPNCGARMVSE